MIRFFLSLFCGLSLIARADAPLPPPEIFTTCSLNGEVCATAFPDLQETHIVDHRRPDELWIIPGWHRGILLANDGQSVVIIYPGLNLLPDNHLANEAMFTIYRRSGEIHVITLDQLYSDLSVLPRTVSHYAWATNYQLTEDDELMIDTEDNRVIRFSMEGEKLTDDPISAFSGDE